MWSGTYSQPGKVEGRFLGPVAPIEGSCDGRDWTGAPVVGDIASITTSGDGSATVAGMMAAHPGCYTWSVAWTARENPLVQAVSPAGEQSETTLIVAPTIVTRTSASATTDPGVFRDTVSTAGTGDLSGSITVFCLVRSLRSTGRACPLTGRVCRRPERSMRSALRPMGSRDELCRGCRAGLLHVGGDMDVGRVWGDLCDLGSGRSGRDVQGALVG